MGGSQSKKRLAVGRGRQQQEQFEQESIMAAIAVNKRQRKLLLKQAKLAKQAPTRREPVQAAWRQSMHQLEPEPEQMCYGSCQSLYRVPRELGVEPGEPFLSQRPAADDSFLKHPIYLPPARSVHNLATNVASLRLASSANRLHQEPARQRRRRLKTRDIKSPAQPLSSQLQLSDYEPPRLREHHPRLGSITTTTNTTATVTTPEHYLSEDEAYFEDLEMASEESGLYLAAETVLGGQERHRQLTTNREAIPGYRVPIGSSVASGLGARAQLRRPKGLAQREVAAVAFGSSREHATRGWPPVSSASETGRATRQRKQITEAHRRLQLQQSSQDYHYAAQKSLAENPPRDKATTDESVASKQLSKEIGGLKPPIVLQQRQQFLAVGQPEAGSNNHHHSSRYKKNQPLLLASGSQSSSSQYSSQSSSADQHQQHQTSRRQMFVQPRYQRGLAYSEEERKRMGLLGLLPAALQDQELQVRGVMNFIENCQDELSKYVYLRHLKDFNERLFYAALIRHVERLMPIVYTPTVGLACQRFSEIYMRPRGLFIRAQDSGRVASLLANWPDKDVRAIVVTDGERILGLGDLGANGMGISIGKLSLYTGLAGIPPENVLPITIDVGTNNESFLKDPFYIGLRERRLRGAQYEALLDEFMEAVVARWGRSCLIQFEDFANATAFKLLERYRDRYCTFNDDIQGTASVCLSGLITAAKLVGRRLADSTFLFYGAGEANLGTANLLIMAMLEEGASRDEAHQRIWLIDSKGLVVSSRTDLSEHKRHYAREAPQLSQLEQIIEHTRPTAIIGASAQGKAFNEAVCRKMGQINQRPIIFALSNPTSKAECTAQEAYQWTEGRCVFASGSPFQPVEFNGKTFITGQGNNAYIFPGVGLAAIAAHLHSIPEDTFLVAARALSDQVTETDSAVGLVYPRLSKIREVTLKVATRVLEHFYTERLATYRPEPEDKLNFLKSIQYDCQYNDQDSTSNTISLGQMSLAENASRPNGNSSR